MASPEKASSQLFAPEITVEQPAVDKRPPRWPTRQKTVEPGPRTTPQPFRKNPLVIGALGAVLLVGVGGLLYSKFRIPKGESDTILRNEQAVWNQAEQLMASSPRRFAEARSKYMSLVDDKSFGTKAQARVQEIEALQKQESDWMEQGNRHRTWVPKDTTRRGGTTSRQSK